MSQCIATIALVVADYDDAISFYVGKLGFALQSDLDMGGGKRWVTVAPPDGGAKLLLAKADGIEQTAHVGNQTGGRVGFFLETATVIHTPGTYVAAVLPGSPAQ